MADQQFCLRWNNHQSTLISVFDTLLENGTLVDCTLAAEGQYLKAHKVVLSACSPYLETLLSQHYEKHPIVILKDVKFTELKSMMDYMYRGEVNISQDQLGTFLKAAESLQIKGLSDNAEGDARDVGSTPKGAPPPKRTAQPAPPVQPQRPESPAHRDGSISPSSRKRRRIRRGSQGEDSNMGDSHLDANSCDLPSQAQSTPIVPNIPSSISTTIKTPIVKPEQTELVNRIDTSNLNSLPPESGLLKEKIEPISEPLLEPKTEYLDDSINDDNVEDLTLDDDDDMDMSNMSSVSNMSRPGPSHGNDVSQGFAPWQLGGNQSGTDEVFMAAQEAVNAHRDSQGTPIHDAAEYDPFGSPIKSRSASPADFAGFSSLEEDSAYGMTQMIIKKMQSSTKSRSSVKKLSASHKKSAPSPIKSSPESLKDTAGVRVVIPRSSKSKAPLIWQKPVRQFATIKTEPEDDYEQPSPKKPVVQPGISKVRIIPEANIKTENEYSCKNYEHEMKMSDIDSEIQKTLTVINKKVNPNTAIKAKQPKATQVKVKHIKDKNQAKVKHIKDKNPPIIRRKKIMDGNKVSVGPVISPKITNGISNVSNIRKGRMQKNRTGPYRCDQCGNKYKYIRGMRQHQKLECNVEPKFPCPYCPTRYRYRHSVREHVRNFHEEAFPKWYATHYVVPHLLNN